VKKIENKIQEIREKPEHVRVRYVMLCVAISMFVVFVVWMMNMQQSFSTIKSDNSDAVKNATDEVQGVTNELKETYGNFLQEKRAIEKNQKLQQDINTSKNQQDMLLNKEITSQKSISELNEKTFFEE